MGVEMSPARLDKGVSAKTQTVSEVQQGSATQQTTRLSTRSHWMHYRTRIVSTADQVNLDFKDAKPELTQQLAHTLASIF